MFSTIGAHPVDTTYRRRMSADPREVEEYIARQPGPGAARRVLISRTAEFLVDALDGNVRVPVPFVLANNRIV